MIMTRQIRATSDQRLYQSR